MAKVNKRIYIKHRPLLLAEIDDKNNVKVWCPFCGIYHHHGVGRDEERNKPMRRAAHCDRSSYRLTESGRMVSITRSPFLETGYWYIDKKLADKRTK